MLPAVRRSLPLSVDPIERSSDEPEHSRFDPRSRATGMSAVMELEHAELCFAVHLAAAEVGTAGTFVATGLVGDSGTAPALDRFPALRRGLKAPVVVHGAESLAGRAGTIALEYDGIFQPVADDVFGGRGVWRVTGADHAYERLEAAGTWTATAVFGAEGLSVDTVYEGRGDFRSNPGLGGRS